MIIPKPPAANLPPLVCRDYQIFHPPFQHFLTSILKLFCTISLKLPQGYNALTDCILNLAGKVRIAIALLKFRIAYPLLIRIASFERLVPKAFKLPRIFWVQG
jgi:hypothetical protein